MSTAASVRPSATSLQLRSPAPVAGVAIDPIRLLKKYYLLLIAAASPARSSARPGRSSCRGCTRCTRRPPRSPATRSRSTQEHDPADHGQDELLRFMGTQIVTMTSPPILNKVA